MSSLNNLLPSATFQQLLNIGSNNTGLTSSLQNVTDGSGTNSVLQLSTTTVNINGTFTINGVTVASSVNADSLLGNATGSTAAASSISLGAAFAFSGSQLQTVAMTGDITTSANSFATVLSSNVVGTGNIQANAVTYAKLQSETASTLLGNPTGTGAVPSEITLDSSLDFTGTTLQRAALTGAVAAAAGSNTTTYSGTVPVNKGGSGQTSFTNGQLLIGNTTGNTLTPATLTAGANITITNGSGAITIASTGSFSMASQVFTASGTYTPTSGMRYCIVEGISGGGGGGNAAITTGNGSSSSGGGGGGYFKVLLTAAQIGTSKAITIGSGGAAGVSGNNGSNGGTTSIGSLGAASGGTGGGAYTPLSATSSSFTLGGIGGAGTIGDFLLTGGAGATATGIVTIGGANLLVGGNGGNSIGGQGGIGRLVTGAGATTGAAGSNFGGGGGGGAGYASATQFASGAGAPGIIYITEFI